MSPDGKRIAYFEYNDGGMNLVVIDIDGNNKKYITNWHDGTWLQRVDWSPDGTKLVLAVFRNYQQNLYIADPATNVLEPIMQDSWEEMDAHWAKDGNIYFAADCDGIWNIYKYDPRSGTSGSSRT
jgi:TolB protein